jgi:uncharacterized protein YecE (DUF72 family)
LPSELELLEKASRRARREERRARQRLLNVQRAKQMHAIRLASVAHASAPPGGVGKEITQKNIHVGCSGWFYWHWKGTFYPADLTTNRWFGHYAKRFSTVELNAPFYSWPTRGTLDTWLRQAGRKQFVYTVKVSELITHVKRFVGTKTLVADFGYIADVLGRRMGYRHDYSKAELSAWVTRIQESGARRIWCYFNNDRDGFAIKNARELIRQLRAAGF